MAAKYIKSSTNLTPKNVWDKLEGGTLSFDDCPWVITGDVYTAVNFTGDGSQIFQDRERARVSGKDRSTAQRE